jgi:hypothetical protein
MSDGRTRLQKIAFEVGDTMFRFAVNPANMKYEEPHRAVAIKTKSRIVVEDFQSDVKTVSISGTTGFNPTGEISDRGIEKIKEMKEFIRSYAEAGGNGATSVDDFYFHDFTNDVSWVVHLAPEGVSYSQDENNPLMHKYEINFIILRNAGDPDDSDIYTPEVGHRLDGMEEWDLPALNPVDYTDFTPIRDSILNNATGGSTSPRNDPITTPFTPGFGAPASSTPGSYRPDSGNATSGPGSSFEHLYPTGLQPSDLATFDPTPGATSRSSGQTVNPQSADARAAQIGENGVANLIGYVY